MPRCQYYLNGLCYSPRTIEKYGNPSGEPADLGYCLSDNYTECPFYAGRSGEELYKYMGVEETGKIYIPIHVIPCSNVSECPFYEIKQLDENACIAKCAFLDKHLTQSSVEKCIRYWDKCPFYRMGAEQATYGLLKH